MHIVHPAVVCKSYVQSIWNTTKIDPKSKKRRPGQSESIQIRPCSTKSMPNRYEKLQKWIFNWFWRCTLEVKMWRKSPNLNENPNSISIARLHADFYQFSVIWRPQNVPKINTFSKFVWKGQFSENHCFSLVKSMFFRFWATKNHTKINPKKRSKNRLFENRT